MAGMGDRIAERLNNLDWNRVLRSMIAGAVATAVAVVVVGVKYGFDSYYDAMLAQTVEEQQARYDDLGELNAARAEWRGQLERGNRMSIGAAMTQLGERGRGAFPAIRPQRGGEMNIAALEGWTELPQEVVQPEPEPEAAAVPPTGGLSPEAIQRLQEALRGIQPAGSPE